MNKRRIPRKKQGGAAAIELALMTLPMVFLTLGAVEFGRVVYQYNIIVKATRDSARLLTAFDPADTASYPETAAKNRVAYIDADSGGTTPRLQGLTTGLVDVCDRLGSGPCTGTFSGIVTGSGTIDLVRVQVSGFVFQPMFGGALLPQITFGPIGTTMMAVR